MIEKSLNSQDWFSKNSFHHSKFSDINRLGLVKKEKNLTISIALPTFNEEATVGTEISIIRTELMEKYDLIDELAVIDSGSTDI